MTGYTWQETPALRFISEFYRRYSDGIAVGGFMLTFGACTFFAGSKLYHAAVEIAKERELREEQVSKERALREKEVELVVAKLKEQMASQKEQMMQQMASQKEQMVQQMASKNEQMAQRMAQLDKELGIAQSQLAEAKSRAARVP